MYFDEKVIFRIDEKIANGVHTASNTSSQSIIGQEDFESSKAWGLATTVDIYGCEPESIRSRDLIVQFTHELCDQLGVKRYGETQVVRFGEDERVYGYSMVQLIETSLVSAHFAEESNAVYLDVFSCKWYDAAAAAELAKKYFQSEDIRVTSCLRY
jgi:S-adenosylmethionine decarboxylase